MGIYYTSYVAKMHFYFFKCRQVKKVKDLYFQLGFLGMKYGNVINDPVRSNETTWKNDLRKLKHTKRAHKEFNHRHKYYYK